MLPRLIAVAVLAFAYSAFSAPLASQSPQSPASPTFSAEVGTLLAARCSACHHPGGPAPFSVLTYEDAAPRAAAIARAVEQRIMPPWKPEPGYGGPFVGERRLSDQEIALLRRWADAGAPRGDAGEPLHAHDPAHDEGWQLGTPDLVVTMPESFVVKAGGPDVFRNFAVPLPIAAARFVKGLEFQPTNHRVTHHANMRIDPTLGSVRLDARDPAPGYEGIAAPTAVFPDGHFLGWTPGQVPPFLPPGMSWRLTPGSSFVVEMHLVPTMRDEEVGFRVGVYFTDIPPSQTPVAMRLGRQNIDIPAGDHQHIVRDRYTLPVDVDVHSVQPHAHYLARDVKGYAILPNGTRQWLIHIKDWDFHAQDLYRQVTPLFLPRGTTVHMEYTYDNSPRNLRNPSSPPMRVRWGQRTNDEMGDLWIQVLPKNARERGELTRSIRAKELAEDIVGYRILLERAPEDPLIRANLADALIRTGKRNEALEHMRAHVRLEPQSAIAHYNLATLLASSGHPDLALSEFRRALELDPEDVFSHNGLGGVLLNSRNDLQGALAAFVEAIRLDPAYAHGYNNIGVVLERLNRPSDAIAAYLKSIEVAPDSADARYNAARLLEAQLRYADALRYLREAVELQPADPDIRRRLAWLLATSPGRTSAERAEALRLADGVAAERKGDPDVLDTLAAALAANGLFPRAAVTAGQAFELLAQREDRARAEAVDRRLALYRQRTPYVAPSP